MKDFKIDTKCVQAGYTPENGCPRQIPIVQSTTFKYNTSEDMGKLFDLEASGYFYTRLQNPTNDYVAKKLAVLEGGSAAMLTSSGQAANFFALFNICENGSHIVASSQIYGGIFNLISVTMKKMGIDVTFVSPDATEEEFAFVSEQSEELPGFNTKIDWERVYPYGDTLKSILGTVSTSQQGIPAEMKEYYLEKGYSLNDRVGISYIEKQYEEYLHGTKAKYEIINSHETKLIEEGKRGKDIVLTIDINYKEW